MRMEEEDGGGANAAAEAASARHSILFPNLIILKECLLKEACGCAFEDDGSMLGI